LLISRHLKTSFKFQVFQDEWESCRNSV